MLSVYGLGDTITENDPCTPGSPSYDPNDPVCAIVNAPLCSVDSDCPSGQTCDASTGICEAMVATAATMPNVAQAQAQTQAQAQAQAQAQSPVATSLGAFGWKTALVLAAIGALGYGGYRLYERRHKAVAS